MLLFATFNRSWEFLKWEAYGREFPSERTHSSLTIASAILHRVIFFLFPSEVQFENSKKKKKDKRNCEEKPKTQKDNNGTQFRVQISEPSPRWTEVEFPSSLARPLVLPPLRVCSDFQVICQEEIPGMSQIHQRSPLAQITSTAPFSLTVIHLGTLKGSEPTLRMGFFTCLPRAEIGMLKITSRTPLPSGFLDMM